MAETVNNELASFQAKVLEEIKLLQLLVSSKEEFHLPPPAEGSSSGPQGFDRWISIGFLRIISTFKDRPLQAFMRSKKIDEYTQQGRDLLQKPETRRRLCPTLRTVDENLSKLKFRSIENDALEVAIAITPLLWSQPRIGDAALAHEPMLFALCAWMIARTGVNNYCAADNI